MALQRRKQRLEIGFVEAQFGGGAAFEYRAREFGFARLQGLDFFFDGAGTDQPVHEHRLVLADAVGAVGGL